MTDIAIRAQNLSKRFHRHGGRRLSLKDRVMRRSRPLGADHIWALRDATFEVGRGQTFGLVGPNGAGKSTALKVLSGIYEPTSGSVTVNGRVSALLELGAGFHPDLTGRENIRMNGSILGLSRRDIDSRLDDIVEFSGLADAIEDPVKTYSSGMYARLGFAIAVNLDPDILIVDEILAVGDEQFQRRCFDYMYQLRQRGTTILVVSHDLTTIEMICDSVAWLAHGEIQQVGPATEVVQAYLRAVNEAESAQPDASALETQPSGRGSGEIQLRDLELLDDHGRPTAEFRTLGPATFRLHYRAHQDLPSVSIGIAFHTETGQVIAAPNSRDMGYVSIPAGAGHVDFSVASLLLNPGTYEVSTYFSAFGHWFDVRDRTFPLNVRGTGNEEAGLTALPGQWAITPKSGTQ